MQNMKLLDLETGKYMNYTQFYGNKFLFVDTNEVEINTKTNLPLLPFFQELQKSLIEKCEVDLIMYYKEIEKPSNDTRKQYSCKFINKDGTEVELCGNALLRLMEQENVGYYIFHTVSGLYEGWNNGNEMGLLMKKARITFVLIGGIWKLICNQ
jgi:diaminopimelate epimerase